MSAYAIVGREAAQVMTACLPRRGQGEAPVRIAEGGQGALALEEAARVPADLLLCNENYLLCRWFQKALAMSRKIYLTLVK